MTAHKHAAMIKAKADNMELVKFIKANGVWVVDNLGSCHFDDACEYFLCLPQHKEACLHWLNGGDVEFFECEKWHQINSKIKWGSGHLFMGEFFKIRIKPRKEKRWIAIRRSDLFVEDCLFHSVENAIRQGYPESQWQLHEIEVEV
ncbi:hypothetical protein V039C_0028 [Vibrio phage V039C]|nr:hypothetical protein V039C_0028 [Vibrio phage V039C]QJD54569.1 hypothetical protein [Vibrio phage phiV039C]